MTDSRFMMGSMGSVLGEKVTRWMADHTQLQVTELVVTQSSDASFHCIAITVFYRDPTGPGLAAR